MDQHQAILLTGSNRTGSDDVTKSETQSRSTGHQETSGDEGGFSSDLHHCDYDVHFSLEVRKINKSDQLKS